MTDQDFQTICKNLRIKYEAMELKDKDVDEFADLISNVLSREDLRRKGSEYDKLCKVIADAYVSKKEKDIRMHPLLCRMYQLCRMYNRYRKRTLTEMERKEEQLDIAQNTKQKYPVCFIVTQDEKPIASCWYKDLDDLNGAANVLKKAMPVLNEELVCKAEEIERAEQAVRDEQQEYNDVLLTSIFKAFNTGDAGIEPNDKNGMQILLPSYDNDEEKVPTCETIYSGIIAIDKNAIEKNKARRGVRIKIDITDRIVTIDCYTVYSIDFYKTLAGIQEDIDTTKLEMLHSNDQEFDFLEASDILNDWTDRLGDIFSLPGSPGLIGSKKPVKI